MSQVVGHITANLNRSLSFDCCQQGWGAVVWWKVTIVQRNILLPLQSVCYWKCVPLKH